MLDPAPSFELIAQSEGFAAGKIGGDDFIKRLDGGPVGAESITRQSVSVNFVANHLVSVLKLVRPERQALFSGAARSG